MDAPTSTTQDRFSLPSYNDVCRAMIPQSIKDVCGMSGLEGEKSPSSSVHDFVDDFTCLVGTPKHNYCLYGPPMTGKRTIAMSCAAEYMKVVNAHHSFGSTNPIRVAVIDAERIPTHRGIEHSRTVISSFISLTHDKMLVILGCNMLSDDAQRSLLSPMTSGGLVVIATCSDMDRMQAPFKSRFITVETLAIMSSPAYRPINVFVRAVMRLRSTSVGLELMAKIIKTRGSQLLKSFISAVSDTKGLSFGQMVVVFATFIDVGMDGALEEIQRASETPLAAATMTFGGGIKDQTQTYEIPCDDETLNSAISSLSIASLTRKQDYHIYCRNVSAVLSSTLFAEMDDETFLATSRRLLHLLDTSIPIPSTK